MCAPAPAVDPKSISVSSTGHKAPVKTLWPVLINGALKSDTFPTFITYSTHDLPVPADSVHLDKLSGARILGVDRRAI